MRTGPVAFLLAWSLTTTAQAGPVTVSYTGNAYSIFVAEGTPTETFTSDNFLHGFFWLHDPLAPNLNGAYVDPVNFMLMDGLIGVGAANADQSSFQYWTDAEGKIVHWSIHTVAFDSSAGFRRTLQTINVPNPVTGNFAVDVATFVRCAEDTTCVDDTGRVVTDPLYAIAALSYDAPGTWHMKAGWDTWEAPPVSQVPEPGTLLLLGAGVVANGVRRRLTHRG